MVLGFDARNWSDFQSASETLAAQVTATDAALAKVYSGTDPAGFITTLGRRAYRRPLTTAEQSTYMTLYNKGSSLIGIAQHVRQGRVAGHPRDAAVAVFPVTGPSSGAKGAPLSSYEMAAKLSLWLRGTSPDDKTLDSGGGHRQARHRGRRGGAGHHDAGRVDGHEGHAPVPRRMAALRRLRA